MTVGLRAYGKNANEGGFTLIELLVSLTVMSVILALLGAGLQVLSKNWTANTERIELIEMVSRTFDILSRDAAGFQRVVVAPNSAAPHYLFTGTLDSLTLVTLEPPYPSEPGPFLVSYRIESSGGRASLVRSRTPYRSGLTNVRGAGTDKVALVDGLFRLHFSYARQGAPGWLTSWTDATSLPDLLRLEIIADASGQAVSPPLIVAIRADAEISCTAETTVICSAKSGNVLRKLAAEAKGSEGRAGRNND